MKRPIKNFVVEVKRSRLRSVRERGGPSTVAATGSEEAASGVLEPFGWGDSGVTDAGLRYTDGSKSVIKAADALWSRLTRRDEDTEKGIRTEHGAPNSGRVLQSLTPTWDPADALAKRGRIIETARAERRHPERRPSPVVSRTDLIPVFEQRFGIESLKGEPPPVEKVLADTAMTIDADIGSGAEAYRRAEDVIVVHGQRERAGGSWRRGWQFGVETVGFRRGERWKRRLRGSAGC